MDKNQLSILIVEDDDLAISLLQYELTKYGKIIVCKSENEFKRKFKSFPKLDIAFVDLDLYGKIEGFKIAKKLFEANVYTVITTGFDQKLFIKRGFEYSKANEYLTKPYDVKALRKVINNYYQNTKQLNLDLFIRRKLNTSSPKMVPVIEAIKSSCYGTSPIYLFGQTGTGKQIIAETIHELKSDNLNKFYHFNCSSVQDSVIESELFGHEKGSFTGADKKKIGLLELANAGTLFLDEISTMSKAMQNKIITAIELKKFRRVGGVQDITSNFRLIAATSSDLTEEVATGNFRSDLFFRLNGTHINIPSLKDRKEDLESLIDFLLDQIYRGKKMYFSDKVIEAFKKYNWPGNIRELKNLLLQLSEKNKSKIDITDIPLYIIDNIDIFNKSKLKLLTKKHIQEITDKGLNKVLEEIKIEAIEYFLIQNRNKVRPASRQLGIHTDAIYTYCKGSRKSNFDQLH